MDKSIARYKMFQLKDRTGLSREEFCNKFRMRMSCFTSMYMGSSPKICIPYCIERLLDYEAVYGTINNDSVYYDLCAELIKLRKNLGLTQHEFSDKFKIKDSTLRSWERGQYSPDESLVYMIDKLITYEDKYGSIPAPRWVSDFTY